MNLVQVQIEEYIIPVSAEFLEDSGKAANLTFSH